MRGWDHSHIEKLKARGMVVDQAASKENNVLHPIEESQKKLKNIPKEEPKPLKEMKRQLQFMKIDFKTEYKFLKERKFRFDIYFEIREKRVGVEYDGIISTHSRHTSIKGFSNDTEKTNLAALNGFIVLRYTVLNYNKFVSHVQSLIRK